MISKHKILIADDLSQSSIELLKNISSFEVDVKIGLKPHELAEIIGLYDALLVRSKPQVSAQIISQAHKIKMIGRAGVGVDNIDVPAALKAGIVVMNTPDGNTITTAEHALSLIFSLARHVPHAHASTSQGKWEKSKFLGTEIHGKTLGIIGLGKIGRALSQKATALGMKVIAFDPMLSASLAENSGATLVSLAQLLATADFISLHTQLTHETRGILGTAAFAAMKDGVRIINAARGGLICEKALLEALSSAKVAGAALDVFEQEPPDTNNPLLKHPRVIVTPHLGASTVEAQERVGLQLAEQTRDYFLHGTIKNAVGI